MSHAFDTSAEVPRAISQPGVREELGSPLSKGIAFTDDDLAHALFTTGRAPGDQAAYGSASVYEALHRCSLVPAYVRRDGAGRLMRSRLAMELDRSEKGALSYALGQAMASIFCAQALGVTHLLHVDRYAVHHGLSFGSGRSRADLFGPGGKGWVVAEAKGRSNNTDGDLVKKLQTQKRTVKSILGSTPWVALGSVACFPDPKYRSLSVLTWDPEDEEHEAIRIEGSLDQFFIAYYAPILVAIESGSEVNYDNREFVTARLDGLALTVGLRSDLYRTLVRRLRPGVPGASAGDLARIALRERYPFFAGNREPDEMEVPIPPPTSDDFDQGHSGATRPGSELAARDQPGSQVFADGTVFATDWGAGTSLDDWHEQ